MVRPVRCTRGHRVGRMSSNGALYHPYVPARSVPSLHLDVLDPFPCDQFLPRCPSIHPYGGSRPLRGGYRPLTGLYLTSSSELRFDEITRRLLPSEAGILLLPLIPAPTEPRTSNLLLYWSPAPVAGTSRPVETPNILIRCAAVDTADSMMAQMHLPR